MEVLLLGIYAFFVWLIFIKLKWLPWNTGTQVTCAIIPVVGLGATILLLNIFAPSSSDLRVVKYNVAVVSEVRGRVIEVPVEEGNRPVKKGDVLFRVDPTPYQLEVDTLEAQLVTMQGSQRELQEQETGARAKIDESLNRAREVSARLNLTLKRVEQYRELAKSGAGSRFDLETAEADALEQKGQLDAARNAEDQARASLRQIQQKLASRVKGEFSQVAQVRAQLENAKWDLEQTTTRSPCDCYVINLQLRPGQFIGRTRAAHVMSLVEADGQVVAFFNQNELHQVAPGNEVEFALKTMPGKVIKGKVDSVVWAQGQGTMMASGDLPSPQLVQNQPPGKFAVKFDVNERDRLQFLAAGAAGDVAIYTEHLHAIHLIRKVILRVGSYLNYLILKLH
jgi:multidrug resistance efflux pump